MGVQHGRPPFAYQVRRKSEAANIASLPQGIDEKITLSFEHPADGKLIALSQVSILVLPSESHLRM